MHRYLRCLLPMVLLFGMGVASASGLIEDLTAKKYLKLGSRLAADEQDLLAGKRSEYDALESFKPLYQQDDIYSRELDAWVSANPKSYVAYLARGTYRRKLGEYRRGEDYVRNVQAEDLQFMQQQFALAKADLRKALELNPRSYLAMLNLMNIAMYEDDNESAQALLDAANQLKKDNLLVRARFLAHLQPRWGGSYSQMKRFIDETRSSGAPEDTVDLLSAIQFDDMGFVQEESGDLDGAANSYRRSLALSAKADPRFVHSYLSHAVDWCSQNCQ